LLDAVVGVASDLSLPDVLRRIVESATRLGGPATAPSVCSTRAVASSASSS
jgi:hypothetical protein